MNKTLASSLCLLVLVTLMLVPVRASAEGWASLTGQLVFDGEAPKPKNVTIGPAVQFCGNLKVKDESLIVNPKNGGIANVGVWLSLPKTNSELPPIHDDYKKLVGLKVKFDNKDCRFEPHMAIVWTEQSVELSNSDPIGHNTHLLPLNPKNVVSNELIPATKSRDFTFRVAESLPVKVECNIHPWMNGWVIVKETPYAAITDEDGKFTIKNIPVGKRKFRFWQEQLGYIQNVDINGTPQKWEKGEVEVKLMKDGDVIDLGVIKVQPKDKK